MPTTTSNHEDPQQAPSPIALSEEQAQAAVDTAEHALATAWADHVREMTDTFPTYVESVIAQIKQGTLPHAPLPADRADALAAELTEAARTLADTSRDRPLPSHASSTLIQLLPVFPHADLHEMAGMLISAGLSPLPFTGELEWSAPTWRPFARAHGTAVRARGDLRRAELCSAREDTSDAKAPGSPTPAAPTAAERIEHWENFFDEIQQLSNQMREQLRATYRQLLASGAPAAELDRAELLLGQNAQRHSHTAELRETMVNALRTYDRTRT